MTLNELAEVLADLAETEGGREVRVATQPSYPLDADLLAVTLLDGKVWLATGEAHGYASSLAWEGGDMDGMEDSDA